ncbi:MAG TPA: DUF983 domain-containing protein [Cryomorphaceae bacterium]|nr:DUF983 domain-containing protein [Owenweeksia sp.]MBF98327.1 DUF983 domain-containing protein [Owenweeksia sp.]HAD97304.1 DUF983 domain-containing protein [Cryomorphaceae bacterium]HBF19678.1 DUF983 domain-containing protein [Cryomorphaceae bacterium]HCQ15703.1 DUF983 domain-containing protein [Cryomorphaceae bacterium]|tara:strand:- start:3404 stop:3802 length:399 start_codon:yes stop_codon:yes gene_type:complete
MKILPVGSKLYSILNFKCPRCHKGEVFESRNPYNLRKMFAMKETCSHCGFRYEVEPAFFYGAMYVSYGYTVAVFIATYIIMNWIYEPSVGDIVTVLGILLVIGSPLIFRLARITWLNVFVKYEPNKRGEKFK